MPQTHDDWVAQTFGVDPQSYTTGEIGRGGGAQPAGPTLPASTVPPKPLPAAQIGPAQSTRATKLVQGMTPEEQQKVQTLLDQAGPDEKTYLTKALATGHSADEVAGFYDTIKGKDPQWMQDHLHLVGDSSGRGVLQQWQMGCGPATVEAMQGELDPVYALKLRTENPALDQIDPTGAGTTAQEQSRMLTSQGAPVTIRGQDAAGLSAVGISRVLNSTTGTTGIKYDVSEVNAGNVDASMDQIGKSFNQGLPTPIVLGTSIGPAHAVLVDGYDPGPPRVFSIHDPYDGTRVNLTEDQIRNNKIGMGDTGQIDRVSLIYKPSSDDPEVQARIDAQAAAPAPPAPDQASPDAAGSDTPPPADPAEPTTSEPTPPESEPAPAEPDASTQPDEPATSEPPPAEPEPEPAEPDASTHPDEPTTSEPPPAEPEPEQAEPAAATQPDAPTTSEPPPPEPEPAAPEPAAPEPPPAPENPADPT